VAARRCRRAVAERWKQVTGCYITEAYGLTEASPGVSASPLDTPWNGMIGLPFPSTEVTIRNEDFKALPPWTGDDDVERHTGEICVRGPQVMKGYWGNPPRNGQGAAGRLAEDRRHRPHDDRGFVTITDRKKDMILVSGFNVYPSEIEGVLASHPGVLECGAIGVPDERTGEAVKVVIVRKDPN
jgi:long-chain acyl-CoA synthetase